MRETNYLIPEREEIRLERLRVKLDDAYKESIEVGIKGFKKGDGEKELRTHITTALSSYRSKLMNILRFQITENEVKGR